MYHRLHYINEENKCITCYGFFIYILKNQKGFLKCLETLTRYTFNFFRREFFNFAILVFGGNEKWIQLLWLLIF